MSEPRFELRVVRMYLSETRGLFGIGYVRVEGGRVVEVVHENVGTSYRGPLEPDELTLIRAFAMRLDEMREALEKPVIDVATLAEIELQEKAAVEGQDDDAEDTDRDA